MSQSEEEAKKLFFEALTFLDSSNFREAELKLREAHKLAPDREPILTNLSIVLVQQNKRVEGREFAEKALATNPRNIEALLVLADCDTCGQRLDAALATYDKIIALNPGIAEAHNNRGLILERLERHTDALASYERALELEPGLSDAHINRGNTRHRLQHHNEALAAFDAAIVLAPDLAEAWVGRGNALHDLKRHDEALAAYDRALALNPQLPHAWLGRGNVFCHLNRYGDASDAYEKALALKPDFAEAWVGRGNALCEFKRHDEALAAYDKALAVSPNFAAACLGRGNVFYDIKHYDAALAAYDKARELNPGFASAWLGCGNVLRMQRRVQNAIDAYRQALKLGGEAQSIGYYLAALGAEPMPAASPEHYVANLFDAYAENFDHDLIDNLKYQTPNLLAAAIRQHTASDALDVLDMGCGTGLMGEQLRAVKRSMTGVDLSAKMLDKARQRKIYDQLICDDLTRFLQTQDNAYDVAVAADVLIYMGDLSPVFAAVRRALRDGGLLAFSVERATDGDFVLRDTLRYAHSLDYLRRLAEQHRFTVETTESRVIRQDAGANIDGYLVVMRCSQ